MFGRTRDEVAQDRKLTGAILTEIASWRSDLDAPRLVIRVDDIAATLSAIVAAGGNAIAERMVILDIGMAFAVFEDG